MVCLRNSVKTEENGKKTTKSPFPSRRRRGRCKPMSKDASGVYIAIQSTVLTGVEMITLVERVDEMVLIGGVECVEQLVMSVCSLLRTSFRALFPSYGSEQEESGIWVCPRENVSTLIISPLLPQQGIDLQFHHLLHLSCFRLLVHVLCCY